MEGWTENHCNFRGTCRSTTSHNGDGTASSDYYLGLNSLQEILPALLLSGQLYKYLPLLRFLITSLYRTVITSHSLVPLSSMFYLLFFFLLLFQSLWNSRGTDLLLEILFRTKLHLRFHLCGIKIKHRNLSNVNAVTMLRTFLWVVWCILTIQPHKTHSPYKHPDTFLTSGDKS